MWGEHTYRISWLSAAKNFMMMLAVMILTTVSISFSSFNNHTDKNIKLFKPVIDKLLDNGVDTVFIYALLGDSNTEFNERFVKINVTNFIGRADYSKHYNDYSVKRTQSFLDKNVKLLHSAESIYDVPKEIIASILWIETRHGNYLGSSHVPSVFLSTALAAEEEYIEMNKQELRRKFKGPDSELPELDKKIIARADKKSNWAIGELIALSEIYNRSDIDIMNLEGSWAGAFGISQFLPSSYINWAVDGDDNGIIDLFTLEDAVFSVGNYLKVNGWDDEENSRRDAVFHYNNSSAYVNAVFSLASMLEDPYDSISSEEPDEEKNRGDIHTPLNEMLRESR
ncbi:MAG: lytic murein transglycosylase [Candidatus Kapaibacterium sp.]